METTSRCSKLGALAMVLLLLGLVAVAQTTLTDIENAATEERIAHGFPEGEPAISVFSRKMIDASGAVVVDADETTSLARQHSTNVSITGGTLAGATLTNSAIVPKTASVALDSGVLALPDSGTVVTVTGTGGVASVSGATAGEVFYLINGTGGALVLTNSATLEVRGGSDLTLGVNEIATLVTRGTTNGSVH